MEDIEEVLKTFRLEASYKGVVDWCDPSCGEGYVLFERKDGSKFRQPFCEEKLKAARAAFTGAEVQWDIYKKEPYTISVLRYIGPSFEERHKSAHKQFSLTTKELEELDI